METVLSVMSVSAVFFCAMVVSLAAKPKFVTKLTCAAAIISGIGGLLVYGYGYALTCENFTVSVIRTVEATCGMFLGDSDWGGISDAAFFQTGAGITLFWLLHLIGLYATASAAITAVGARILQKIRIFLSRRGDLVLIFGVHEDSVAFGKALSKEEGISVVYVDAKAVPGCAEQIRTSAGVLRSDDIALKPGKKLLRSLGLRPGKRKVWLYALSREQSENVCYATEFAKAMTQRKLLPEQSKLFLLGTEESLPVSLLAAEGHSGYGDVMVMDEPQMAARLLISKYPPVKTLTFQDGVANADMNCLVLGFGKVGQAVLQQLLIHGQFLGSHFRADVFDPNYEQVTGGMLNRAHLLMQNYDIRFHAADARSRQLYDYLKDMEDKLNYVVVCAGGGQKNEEIACELLNYFARLERALPVYLCDHGGVRCMKWNALPEQHSLYCTDVLRQNKLDKMAMELNHVYNQRKGTPEGNWAKCDYFDRMSSRASADFMPAFLHISGVDRETALNGGWNPQNPLLENMAMTEHLRWCAFHYVMGYSPMDEATFRKRSKDYQDGKLDRISKDKKLHIHACMIPWDKLDDLSKAENAVIKPAPGKEKNYKQVDVNNVLMLPDILGAGE